MELLEYYHLIRARIWIVILGISTALAIVVIYQLLPASERHATGRLRVHEAGTDVLVYRAGDLDARNVADFWRTFETIIESRVILDGAAIRAGLTGPEIRARLKPLQAEQPSPGYLMDVTGGAPTADDAGNLTQAAMAYVIEYWNQSRIDRCRQIRAAIAELRQQQLGRLQAAEQRVGEARGAALSPVQELSRAEGDLAVTVSQVDAQQLDVAVAENRLATTQQVVAEEAARPPEQRTLAAGPGDVVQAQILSLRVQLATQLARRKPDHPEVRALRAQIDQLQRAVAGPEGTDTAPQLSPALSRELLTAQLAVDEARARRVRLQERADALRGSLPALRQRADQFAQAELEAAQAQSLTERMAAQLETVDAEQRRLQAQLETPATPEAQAIAPDIEILDDAEILPSPKTWPRFFLLVLAAILGGGILSSVVILGLHYTSVVFTNEAEARAMLHTRILGAIPRSDLPIDQAGPPLQGR